MIFIVVIIHIVYTLYKSEIDCSLCLNMEDKIVNTKQELLALLVFYLCSLFLLIFIVFNVVVMIMDDDG